MTSVSCGDPVQEFARDLTSGRRFQQKEPTMPRKSKPRSRSCGWMLPIMHPDAAGIDIGSEEIFVSVHRSGYRFGPSFRNVYSRFAGSGRLASPVQYPVSSDGVNWRLLDSKPYQRHARRERSRPKEGKCSRDPSRRRTISFNENECAPEGSDSKAAACAGSSSGMRTYRLIADAPT